MKICLVGPPDEGDSKRTGLITYSDHVKFALPAETTIEYVEFDVSTKAIIPLIKNFFIRPFFKVLKANKNSDVVHFIYEFGAVYSLFTKNSVVTVHHVISEDEKNGPIWSFFWKTAMKMTALRSKKIIAISSQTKNELIEQYGIPEDKIALIVSPVRNEMKILEIPKEKIIGCMGSLCIRKNHESALRVFSEIIKKKEFSDYHLKILGQGSQEDNLKSVSESLGISDRVEFLKDLSSREVVEFYNRCRLVLNTSLHEGLGMVTLEAQACGTPVLYFDYARMPEEIVRTALPCRDEADMVSKAVSLLSDEKRYEEVRKKGSEYVADLGTGFDRKLMSVYREVMQ
jgi:glycosyltransferase involved in cell wall biosynthesis